MAKESTSIGLAITGAAGRMGQRLIALCGETPGLRLAAAIERPDHERQSADAGEVAGIGRLGVPITYDCRARPDVLIDFSAPDSTRHWMKACRDRGIPMVIGTTGLQAADHAAIDVASSGIPILQAPNMSLGVNVLLQVAAEVARRLGPDYDIEVVEAHHRFKKDAPSGTALALADAVLLAVGRTRADLAHGRQGDYEARKPGEVGMHALRLGDEVGRHTVHFAALGERIELTHQATSRDTFARGALRAAAWLVGQPPGRYTMADLLGGANP